MQVKRVIRSLLDAALLLTGTVWVGGLRKVRFL